MLIDKDGQIVEVDARPSDAVTLAIGDNVPVYVAEGVLAQAGIGVEKNSTSGSCTRPPSAKLHSRPGEVEL